MNALGDDLTAKFVHNTWLTAVQACATIWVATRTGSPVTAIQQAPASIRRLVGDELSGASIERALNAVGRGNFGHLCAPIAPLGENTMVCWPRGPGYGRLAIFPGVVIDDVSPNRYGNEPGFRISWCQHPMGVDI